MPLLRAAMIRHFFFTIILLFASPVLAQNENRQDPIYEKLSIAKSTYVTEVGEAAQVVVQAIDAKIERAEESSSIKVDDQIAMLKELVAQRKAFLNNPDELPSDRSFRSVNKKFSRRLRASRKKLTEAFDDAADKYRKPPIKDFAAAAKILEERETFFEELKRGKVKGEAKNIRFDPTFDEENWSVTWPRNVEIKDDRLVIVAAQEGNIALTKKTNYQEATVVVELAASEGTEAYIILNAQQKNGKWSGATSKIHFAEGKINAGGQRFGFMQNQGTQKQFEVGEYFTLKLDIHLHRKDDEKMLVKSYLNGKQTANLAWKKDWTNATGAVGFMVKKGALSIRSFSVSQGKDANKSR